MKTNVNSDNKLTMLSQVTNDSKFQILEYDKLQGAVDIDTALRVNSINNSGLKLRQVRIILNDSAVKLEPGALSFFKGDIELRREFRGLRGLGKKIFSNKIVKEAVVKQTYEGSGEIFLEPSFGHYALVELEEEEIIVDNGLFYACEDSIELEEVTQKSTSIDFFSEEGIFQTSIKGSGIVVLELPVPETEIFKCKLFNDTLKVDGDFAVLRTGNVSFSLERTEYLDGNEGFLHTYSGVGEVWLLPTQNIYFDLRNINNEEKI